MPTIFPPSPSLFMEANTRNFSRNFNFRPLSAFYFSTTQLGRPSFTANTSAVYENFQNFLLSALFGARRQAWPPSCAQFNVNVWFISTTNKKHKVGDKRRRATRKSETFYYFSYFSCFLSLLTFSFASDKSKQMTLSFVYVSSPRHRPVLFMNIPNTETEKSLMGGENCLKKGKLFLPFFALFLRQWKNQKVFDYISFMSLNNDRYICASPVSSYRVSVDIFGRWLAEREPKNLSNISSPLFHSFNSFVCGHWNTTTALNQKMKISQSQHASALPMTDLCLCFCCRLLPLWWKWKNNLKQSRKWMKKFSNEKTALRNRRVFLPFFRAFSSRWKLKQNK